MSGRMMPIRERIWAALRANKDRDLSLDELDRIVALPMGEGALDFLRGLTRAGYLRVRKAPGKRCIPKNMYRLINDTGVDVPMIKKNGEPSGVGYKTTNIWRTMRILKRFNYIELTAHASTHKTPLVSSYVRQYMVALHCAGYLKIVKEPENKGKNRGLTPAVYVLVKDTGAKAPMVQKLKTVYDPNLHKVMYQEEPGNEHE